MSSLEKYFHPFREQIIGQEQTFLSPYGERKIIYADWTASGRLYRPIEEKMLQVFAPFVANTHTESNITGTTMTMAYHQALETIKDHVNADELDVIITDGSGMTGVVNKLQRLLGLKVPEKWSNRLTLSEEERPVIFITHMEHHSNHISWVETIGEVVILQPDAETVVHLEHFQSLLEKYRHRKVKIGSFTACSNVTGIQTPFYDLAKMIHQHGGICFVDFSASAPYVELNMHPNDPLQKLDGIFFSPHKFLGGPGTSGVLIFDSRLYANSVPDEPGGGTVNWTNPWGGRSYISSIEAREDGGTPGFLQAIRTALAIKLKEKMGIENILKREKELLGMLFDGLEKIPHLHILDHQMRDRLGTISFYVEDIHYNLLVRILNDRYGIQVRGGCSCAGTYGHYLLHINSEVSRQITDQIDTGDLTVKPGWVRLSIHPTMTDAEILAIVEAIKDLVLHMDQYKQVYRYDLQTNEFLHVDSQPLDRSNWFVL